MPIVTNPEWLQLAVYAGIAALVLIGLFKIPYVGKVLRSLLSFGLLAFCLFLLFQQAPFDPNLSQLTERLGLDSQEVVGDEVRIAMARDGHFWVRVMLNGVERRMLVDSGATVTAISEETADAAGVERSIGAVPVLVRTANGTVPAETGRIERLGIGGIAARNLNVVISPALGNVDVLGMNFLSRLASWRVEGKTLIMVPKTAGKGAARE